MSHSGVIGVRTSTCEFGGGGTIQPITTGSRKQKAFHNSIIFSGYRVRIFQKNSPCSSLLGKKTFLLWFPYILPQRTYKGISISQILHMETKQKKSGYFKLNSPQCKLQCFWKRPYRGCTCNVYWGIIVVDFVNFGIKES